MKNRTRNKSWKYAMYILYLLPFMNISANRGFSMYLLIIIGFLALKLLSCRTTSNTIEENRVMKVGYMLIASVIAIGVISLLFGINNLEMLRFFCLFPFFFPLMDKISQKKEFVLVNLNRYLYFLSCLVTLSIGIDFVLMQIGLITMQPMYKPEAYTYHVRPFGIFGQPSVNSCLLCFFYIFHRAINKYLHIHTGRDVLFIVVLAGCILQGSGSGFLSLIFVLFCKFGVGKKLKIPAGKLLFVAAFFCLAVAWVILNNKVDKISADYFNELYEYTNDELWTPYLYILKNPINLLFGFPDFPISIDFGPLYLVGTVGLVYFIIFSIYAIFLYRKSRSIDMKIGIVSLLVGNLHYPVMFYFVMNGLWFFITYYILVIENGKRNQGRSCAVNI